MLLYSSYVCCRLCRSSKTGSHTGTCVSSLAVTVILHLCTGHPQPRNYRTRPTQYNLQVAVKTHKLISRSFPPTRAERLRPCGQSGGENQPGRSTLTIGCGLVRTVRTHSALAWRGGPRACIWGSLRARRVHRKYLSAPIDVRKSRVPREARDLAPRSPLRSVSSACGGWTGRFDFLSGVARGARYLMNNETERKM